MMIILILGGIVCGVVESFVVNSQGLQSLRPTSTTTTATTLRRWSSSSNSVPHPLCSSLLSLSMSNDDDGVAADGDKENDDSSICTEVPDLRGKMIYQRAFYRLLSESDVDEHNAVVVEERVRFVGSESSSDIITPVGPRTLIVRDGCVEDGDIGDELFRLDVDDDDNNNSDATDQQLPRHNGLRGRIDSDIATILYVAANRDRHVRGRVLELECKNGIAGLVGCIAAGAFQKESERDENKDDNDEASSSDDILTIPKKKSSSFELSTSAAGAAVLERLTLSDPNDNNLNHVMRNARRCKDIIPPSKLKLERLDWKRREATRGSNTGSRQRIGLRIGDENEEEGSMSGGLYHTILASNVEVEFTTAKQLARTAAYRLRGWDRSMSSSSPSTAPNSCFLRITSMEEENLDVRFLIRFLEKGYKMTVSSSYMKMQTLKFGYQILDREEDENTIEDMEIEVLDIHDDWYNIQTAIHHPDYVEGSGEYFFPMENGQYDSDPRDSSFVVQAEAGGNRW